MYAFDFEELAVIDAEATAKELDELVDAEVLVREQTGSSAPSWRLRHATLKDVAYASLPKRERMRLHQLVADHLLAAGHRSLAADHLELGALASLDLDPNDRTAAERAADALLVAGDRARRRMEIRSAIDRYGRALFMAGPEARWVTGQVISIDGGQTLSRAFDASPWVEPVFGADRMRGLMR